eukprot:scaffold204861_cov34-Tisochrysis_lutea.AAC.6
MASRDVTVLIQAPPPTRLLGNGAIRQAQSRLDLLKDETTSHPQQACRYAGYAAHQAGGRDDSRFEICLDGPSKSRRQGAPTIAKYKDGVFAR